MNLKDDVITALKADSTLTGLLTGFRVFAAYPLRDATAKGLIVQEEMNRPAFFADDAERGTRIEISVEAFTPKNVSTSTIADEVNRVMTGLGFVRSFRADLDDEARNRKRMKFVITKEV